MIVINSKDVPALIFMMAYSFPCLSESEVTSQKDITTPRSPKMWKFAEYGKTEHNFLTGTMGFVVPLYQYTDVDLSISPVVKYSSVDYMPNKPSGIVSLDWYLEIGGNLTRQVRGLPAVSTTYTVSKGIPVTQMERVSNISLSLGVPL